MRARSSATGCIARAYRLRLLGTGAKVGACSPRAGRERAGGPGTLSGRGAGAILGGGGLIGMTARTWTLGLCLLLAMAAFPACKKTPVEPTKEGVAEEGKEPFGRL